tara:strand:+ start:141 stop:776 length:636 start_codon:yes stop_codon:yes gene_type:complete
MESNSNYNINLFKKLLNETIEDKDKDKEICLITNEKLEDNNIKLSCGHKFNYEALYNEVVYQKTKKLLDNKNLKINEIKCPYCRTITDNLLPFYKYYSVKSIRGVTHPEEYSIKLFECVHIKNGKKCTNSACKTENGILCNKHLIYKKIDEEIIKTMEDNFYKIYKKKNIKDLKEELKNFKLKVGGKKEELINRLYIHKKLQTKDLETKQE